MQQENDRVDLQAMQSLNGRNADIEDTMTILSERQLWLNTNYRTH